MYNRLAVIVLSFFYIVIVSTVYLQAQDVTKIAPKNYKILIDNEKVRAIDFLGNPGEITAWHSHPDYLVYVIEGGTSKMNTKDGKSKITEFKKGQTLWMDATTHETQNIGKTKIHLLLVELKK